MFGLFFLGYKVPCVNVTALHACFISLSRCTVYLTLALLQETWKWRGVCYEGSLTYTDLTQGVKESQDRVRVNANITVFLSHVLCFVFQTIQLFVIWDVKDNGVFGPLLIGKHCRARGDKEYSEKKPWKVKKYSHKFTSQKLNYLPTLWGWFDLITL